MLVTVTCHVTIAEQFDWLRLILTKIGILMTVQDMRQSAKLQCMTNFRHHMRYVLTVSIFSSSSSSPVPFCVEAVEGYKVASLDVITGRTMSWMMSFNPTS